MGMGKILFIQKVKNDEGDWIQGDSGLLLHPVSTFKLFLQRMQSISKKKYYLVFLNYSQMNKINLFRQYLLKMN